MRPRGAAACEGSRHATSMRQNKPRRTKRKRIRRCRLSRAPVADNPNRHRHRVSRADLELLASPPRWRRILLVGGIVLLVIASMFGGESLEWLAIVAFFAWAARDGYRTWRDPNRPRGNVPTAYWVAFFVVNALLVTVGGYLSRNAPEMAIGSFRLREVVLLTWMVVLLGGLTALAVAEQVLARRRRE